MKKLFLSVISLIMAATCLFAGCSCNGEAILSFNEGYKGGNSNLVGETLVYDVISQDSYGTEFKKDEGITNALIEYSYNGTFTLAWEQIASIGDYKDLSGNFIKSNLISPDADHYYKLTSTLNITANYPTVMGVAPEKTEYEDVIETQTFFSVREESFAPIYTQTIANYSNVFIYEEFVTVTTTKFSAYTIYQNDRYDSYMKVGEAQEFIKNSYDYTYRSVMDNAQLLFLIRNMEIAENSSINVPTVSYAYGEAKTLIFIDRSSTLAIYDNPLRFPESQNVLTFDGTPVTTDAQEAECRVPVRKIGFYVNETTAAGTEQTVLVQKQAFGNLPNRALPMQYIEPIAAHNSFQSLGVLNYTLREVTSHTN